MTGLVGWQLQLLQSAMVVALGVLAVLAGSPLVKNTFRWVDRTSGADPESPATPTEGPDPTAAEVLEREQPVAAGSKTLRGGAWIGRLERLSIFSGLLAGFPEAIAICLAMKGLARYPELKAPSSGAAEAFIIGTFVSVLWACGCAGLALWLVGVL